MPAATPPWRRTAASARAATNGGCCGRRTPSSPPARQARASGPSSGAVGRRRPSAARGRAGPLPGAGAPDATPGNLRRAGRRGEPAAVGPLLRRRHPALGLRHGSRRFHWPGVRDGGRHRLGRLRGQPRDPAVCTSCCPTTRCPGTGRRRPCGAGSSTSTRRGRSSTSGPTWPTPRYFASRSTRRRAASSCVGAIRRSGRPRYTGHPVRHPGPTGAVLPGVPGAGIADS